MLILTLIGAVLMTWCLLRILGDERQQRVQTLRLIIEAEREAAAERRNNSR